MNGEAKKRRGFRERMEAALPEFFPCYHASVFWICCMYAFWKHRIALCRSTRRRLGPVYGTEQERGSAYLRRLARGRLGLRSGDPQNLTDIEHVAGEPVQLLDGIDSGGRTSGKRPEGIAGTDGVFDIGRGLGGRDFQHLPYIDQVAGKPVQTLEGVHRGSEALGDEPEAVSGLHRVILCAVRLRCAAGPSSGLLRASRAGASASCGRHWHVLADSFVDGI